MHMQVTLEAKTNEECERLTAFLTEFFGTTQGNETVQKTAKEEMLPITGTKTKKVAKKAAAKPATKKASRPAVSAADEFSDTEESKQLDNDVDDFGDFADEPMEGVEPADFDKAVRDWASQDRKARNPRVLKMLKTFGIKALKDVPKEKMAKVLADFAIQV
jgi:hypothetical protein